MSVLQIKKKNKSKEKIKIKYEPDFSEAVINPDLISWVISAVTNFYICIKHLFLEHKVFFRQFEHAPCGCCRSTTQLHICHLHELGSTARHAQLPCHVSKLQYWSSVVEIVCNPGNIGNFFLCLETCTINSHHCTSTINMSKFMTLTF